MADCELSIFPVYDGNAVCSGTTEQEKMDNYCAWNTYFKDTFTPAVRVFSTELATCVNWIDTAKTEIEEDRVYVENSVSYIENTLGAEFLGKWTTSVDYTNKSTTYDNILWIGLAPTIDEVPSFSLPNKWLFVKYIEKKVYVNTDYTASGGDIIYVDTSSTIVTITLPIAVDGMRVRVIDREWMFDVNSCNVIDANGIINKITDGTPYEIDVKGATRTLEVVKNASNTLEWRTV